MSELGKEISSRRAGLAKPAGRHDKGTFWTNSFTESAADNNIHDTTDTTRDIEITLGSLGIEREASGGTGRVCEYMRERGRVCGRERERESERGGSCVC